MKNLTIITEFVFMLFSRNPQILNMLFALFLVIYLLPVLGNLVMILVIRTDSHLKTPMSFFLGHPSFLDLSLSSITMPKMLENLLTQRKLSLCGAAWPRVSSAYSLGAQRPACSLPWPMTAMLPSAALCYTV